MVKLIFYAPLLIFGWLKLMLPKRVFISVYSPSSPVQRELENKLRNKGRKLAYITRRELVG